MSMFNSNFASTADIAVIGLAVMGENLILNFASKGFRVAAHNRSFFLSMYVITLTSHFDHSELLPKFSALSTGGPQEILILLAVKP
jgi:6-phosphogluconate dehydrogenase